MKKKFSAGNITKKSILFILSLFYIVPVWMVLTNSLKGRAEANLMGVGLPTDGLHWENYQEVIERGGIVRAFWNGVLEASASSVIIIFAASACALVLSRMKGKLYNAIYYMFIMGLIVPVAYIPTYLVLNTLNLLNTYIGIILIFSTYGFPMAIFLYTGFIKTIPRELDEAAIIDGCGTVRLYGQIIFPLLKPITATEFILAFVGGWNDVMIPMFFSNGNKWALPLTVYNFYGSYQKYWDLVFADIIITIAPLIIIYLCCQKQIVAGMTAGAVKG